MIESATTNLLAHLMMREGRFEEAIKALDEARALADDSNAVQMQMIARRGLAQACLQTGDISRARTFIEEAAKHRYPNGYESVLALSGVITLRHNDTEAAANAFEGALSEAERQVAGTARGYSPAYAKALALAGLALCRDNGLVTAAVKAYREARAISTAPGVVVDELQKLDGLAIADSTDALKLIRAAAAGEA